MTIDIFKNAYSKNEYEIINLSKLMRLYIKTDIYSINKKLRDEYQSSVKDYYIEEDEDLTIFHLTQRYSAYIRKLNKY